VSTSPGLKGAPRPDHEAGSVRRAPRPGRGGLASRARDRATPGLQPARGSQARAECGPGGRCPQARGAPLAHALGDEEYAFARPSLVREKVRRLELLTGAERHRGKRTGIFSERAQHDLEKELAARAEVAYQRLVTDWAPGRRTVREPQRGRASQRRRASTGAAGISPRPCTSVRRAPAPKQLCARPIDADKGLDFHP
jgi:hypothetical protein